MCVLPQKITADEYMMEKMRALLEGRSMMEPMREKITGSSFPPGLIHNYDVYERRQHEPRPRFELRIPPNRPVDLNIAYPVESEF